MVGLGTTLDLGFQPLRSGLAARYTGELDKNLSQLASKQANGDKLNAQRITLHFKGWKYASTLPHCVGEYRRLSTCQASI